MSLNLKGLLLPITTPFNGSQEIDFDALATNLRNWNTRGVVGYVVLGSTGERVNLDESEYLRLIERARQETPAGLSFIVGAGQQSTRGTIKEIDGAVRAGAQAVLVITPNFYRSAISQTALIAYYTAVADAAKVPVLLYSMPDLTGITIEPETAAQLSQHPNIVGMKDSSNNIERFNQAVQMVEQNFAMMIGNGTVFADALRAGAQGGILAVGCCAPQICLDIYRAFQANDYGRANELQELLTPLARAVTKTYGIGGLKTAMEMAGFAGGSVRAPLQRPNAAACAEIQQMLRVVSAPEAAATGSSS